MKRPSRLTGPLFILASFESLHEEVNPTVHVHGIIADSKRVGHSCALDRETSFINAINFGEMIDCSLSALLSKRLIIVFRARLVSMTYYSHLHSAIGFHHLGYLSKLVVRSPVIDTAAVNLEVDRGKCT